MSKKGEEERENTWETFLTKVVPPKQAPNSALIVFGDKKNGKGELLKKFRERGYIQSQTQQQKDFVFEYSYTRVKNIHDESDPEEVHAHMNIWEVDNYDQTPGLLPLFIKSVGLQNTAYMITLDLSQPWNVMASLTKWVEVLQKAHDEVFAKLSAEEQKDLKRKISTFNQVYIDPSKKDDPQALEQKQQAEQHVDLNQPKMNFGVPLIILGCKADALQSVFASQSVAGDRFEFLTRKLRLFCLDYGASLIFASSVGPSGTFVDVTQEYLYHRLYKFDFNHKPKATGSDTDYTFLIPSGMDSVDLIRRINPAKRFDDNDTFDNVFKHTASNQQNVEKKEDDEVKADDNQVFFGQLKFNIQHKTEPSLQAPVPAAAANMASPRGSMLNRSAPTAPEQRAAVQSFFQSLLVRNPRQGGRPDG